MRQTYSVPKKSRITLLMSIMFIVQAWGSALAADRYIIDPTHTYTIFEYSHWGLSLQKGRFDKNSGFIELDTENKTGAVQIEIDASSVSTGNSLFDNTLRSSNFFDAATYPKVIFKSTRVLFDLNDKVIGIEGELSIKSVTRTVKFELTQFTCRFMPLYLKTACGANGYTKILRSDFDMARYTPFVSDEVSLYFIVEAIRE
ncbi:MAG: YceI family protein [Undibacterium sp.]|nr:YceI family protein [Undibacterium sp.]